MGISAATFHRALKELLARGFIDIADSGNWYEKQPTKFSISYRFMKYGQPDFQAVPWERGLPAGLGFQKKTKDAIKLESQQTIKFDSETVGK